MKFHFHIARYILLILVCPLINIYSQNIIDTEKRYISVSSSIDKEQNKLDSLNALLNERAAGISREKSNKDPDKTRITNLMSNSISLSNLINESRRKIITLEKKREDLKGALRTAYNHKIDSLNTLRQSGVNNSDLDLQILTYSQKKLSVVPRFPDLSFNPEMIISIEPASIKNSEEMKILRDYLNNALSEINEKINYLDKQYAEINQILSLQKKAEKFLEETDYNNEYSFSRNKGTTAAASGGPKEDYNNSREYLSNALNVNGMLNQFRAIEQGDTKPRSVPGTNLSNLSLKDYLKLVKELKENLTAFRVVLNYKLKSF